MKDKLILKNVMTTGWGETSANPYVGTALACLDALRETSDFRLAAAVSGVGYAYTWALNTPNDAILADEAMVKRTFAAFGYDTDMYPDPRGLSGFEPLLPKEFYIQKVIDSISMGVPLVGFGLTKDYPYSCAIIGYEDEGYTLYLRSYWNDGAETDPETGYLKVEDWYKNCYGIAVINRKTKSPLKKDALIKHILCSAIDLAEKPFVEFFDVRQHSGTAALDQMINVLLDDSYWPAFEESHYDMMEASYLFTGLLLFDHCRNWLASPWMEEHAKEFSVSRDILDAAKCYREIGSTMNKFIQDNRFVIVFRDFEKHIVREQTASYIEEIKQKDLQAVECYKKALRKL